MFDNLDRENSQQVEIYTDLAFFLIRAVARSENLGGHIVLGGDNVPPLVEIGLTDLPKSGGARAPPAPPLATGLNYVMLNIIKMI